jgi:hypothetical protein
LGSGESSLDSDSGESNDSDNDNRKTGKNSKKKRNSNSISRKSRESINKAQGSSKGIRVSTGDKRKLSASALRRLRSRNKVIDHWLGDEDGSDAYADLEDFLVE